MATEKDTPDNPPAFPQPGLKWDEDGNEIARSWDEPGMTLLDSFAGKVLEGLYSNPNVVVADSNVGWSLCNCNHQGLASEAYAAARAMLRERSK